MTNSFEDVFPQIIWRKYACYLNREYLPVKIAFTKMALERTDFG